MRIGRNWLRTPSVVYALVDVNSMMFEVNRERTARNELAA